MTTNVTKDLRKHLDTAYELLHKIEQYQPADIVRMTQELIDFKKERALLNFTVPCAISGAIAAGLFQLNRSQ